MLRFTILTVYFITNAIVLTGCSENITTAKDTNPNQTIAQIATTTQKYTGIVGAVDDIAQQITVRIATPKLDSHGSGVIIAQNGNTYYVATAGHVLDQSGEYTIVTLDGEQYKLDNQTIIKSDGYDFAVFSFESDKDYTVATIGNYTVAANSDQTAFVSGFPGIYAPNRIITGGKVREQDNTSFRTKDSSSFIGTTTEGAGLLYSNISYGGMSGGAVLDSEGRLIGINTGAENELYFDEEGNNSEIALGFSLGIPIGDVLAFLERETPLKSQSLQITQNPAREVNDSDYESIEEQLLTTEAPQNKTDLSAWMNYGNQLWRYERYSEAIDAFEQVITIDPEFDRAYYAMGLAHWYQKDYEQAVTSLQKATQINPNPYFYWRYLGYSYKLVGKYDEALAAYEEAISKSPDDFVLYVEYADVNSESSNYEEAINSYDKAVSLNPNHSWAYTNRGSLYAEQEKFDLALADYSKAIELDPYDASAYNNLGRIYFNQKQFDSALTNYNKAIELNSNHASAYHNRGNFYLDRGESDLALADYNKAIELDPNYFTAYYNRANLYRQQGDLESAFSDYNRAIEINPVYAIAYINRGSLYYSQQQFDLALSDYNKAISLDPKSAEAHYNRGLVYLQKGESNSALSDLQQTIKIDPNYADAYVNLGLLYWQSNNITQARTNLQQAQRLFIAKGDSISAGKIAEFLQQLP